MCSDKQSETRDMISQVKSFLVKKSICYLTKILVTFCIFHSCVPRGKKPWVNGSTIHADALFPSAQMWAFAELSQWCLFQELLLSAFMPNPLPPGSGFMWYNVKEDMCGFFFFSLTESSKHGRKSESFILFII